MRRLLAGMLVIGIVGCGDSSAPQNGGPTPTLSPLPRDVAESATTVVTPPPTNVGESPVQIY